MSKKKNTTSKVRTSSRKVTITNTAKGLTSQAGLIPVVKFLHKLDLISLIKDTVDHKRGDTALYDAVDAIFLSIIGLVGGARSLSGIVTVWSDGILRRLAGWLRIPEMTVH